MTPVTPSHTTGHAIEPREGVTQFFTTQQHQADELMTLELLKTLLLYCLVFNLAFVSSWFLIFTYAHDWMFNLHRKCFQVTLPQFDALNYAGMMLYKIATYFLNVAQMIALWLTT
ncbi:DUF6868 family protein [Methylomonas sp. AM2-LC]|uniref:DUF6868 family protein n=1 Tax=Methylomonas sp. AM2-LC TaxID=3153301 RepID=UPI003265278E